MDCSIWSLADKISLSSVIVNGLAFFLLALTALMQRSELRLQREELKNQREESKRQTEAFNEQSALLLTQTFETTFFSMLHRLESKGIGRAEKFQRLGEDLAKVNSKSIYDARAFHPEAMAFLDLLRLLLIYVGESSIKNKNFYADIVVNAILEWQGACIKIYTTYVQDELSSTLSEYFD